MATFWPKSLLTARFAEQQGAQGEQDGHGAEEEEAATEAGGARDAPNQGRADEEAEVAENRDGRQGGAAGALSAEPPGERKEGRRRQREPRAGDHEPDDRDERAL